MTTTELLEKIASLQEDGTKAEYQNGLFASKRVHPLLNYKREDNNIFFSLATLYILQQISKTLSVSEKETINLLTANILPTLSQYCNQTVRNTYNFWPKIPQGHFPNGKTLHKYKHFSLPDDIDTTAMAQMVSNTEFKSAYLTKKSLPQHANQAKLEVKNTLPEFKHLRAYSTWFGEKMPIELDVCVLSNMLLWNNHYRFPKTREDIDTLFLIRYTIQNGLYFNNTFKISPEYPSLPIILYHLSRTVAEIKELKDTKEILITDLKKAILINYSAFEKMLLKTSLLRLEINTETEDISTLLNSAEKQWWFTAGLLSAYGNPLIQLLAPSPIFHFRFICPAFNYTLILEHIVLSKKLMT